MSLFFPEPAPHPNSIAKTGVLLLNIGAPERLSAGAVKEFLWRFLRDPRVIELNPAWWRPLLKFIILPKYHKTSLTKYQKIWPEGHKESPLAALTRELTTALEREFAAQNTGFIVRYAMNYSAPTVTERLLELKSMGVKRLILLPLFPQYSGTTTAAALDQVWAALTKIRVVSEITTINQFYDSPLYINALARHIADFRAREGRGQKLLFSFHSLPESYVKRGDPYREQCLATAHMVASALNLKADDYLISFQSKFGRGKWLGPATSTLLSELPKKGVNYLDIVAPSFVVDCLETLEELAITGKEQFLAAGGKKFNYIPCLNSNPMWVTALAQLIVNAADGARLTLSESVAR